MANTTRATGTRARKTKAETQAAVAAAIVADGNGSAPPLEGQVLSKNALNLDALEREGAPEPFEVFHGGRLYKLTDPKEIDWQDLIAALGNPALFFRRVLPESEWTTFMSTKMPTWKMNKLMEKYLQHYGLPDLPNAIGLSY